MLYNYQQKISSAFDRLIIKPSLFLLISECIFISSTLFYAHIISEGSIFLFSSSSGSLLSMSLEGLEDEFGLYLYVNVCK